MQHDQQRHVLVIQTHVQFTFSAANSLNVLKLHWLYQDEQSIFTICKNREM